MLKHRPFNYATMANCRNKADYKTNPLSPLTVFGKETKTYNNR